MVLGDNFTSYLQIFLTIAGAISVIFGAFKYFNKHIDDMIDDKLQPNTAELNRQHEELRHDMNLLKQTVEFIEKYFISKFKNGGSTTK